MPEIIKLLLPTNNYMFAIWAILILLIIFKSRKISSKWFSIELDKISPKKKGLESEMFLRDRLLKEYKIFRINLTSEINKIIICFRYHFKDTLVKYIESIENDSSTPAYDCIVQNKSMVIKNYEILLELIMKTIISPALTNIVFRNGFPILPSADEIGSKQYEEDMRKFDKVCMEKYNNILMTMELSIDTELFDLSINNHEFKQFYHITNNRILEILGNEMISFFKKMVMHKYDITKAIYKDYHKMFDEKETCHKFVEHTLREFYE